ncbi:TetR/AcrR family transcriptional regulator [Povalibacter sp.]|uniref:TetR/AcrR family transcriptional regulator n=1 Tax=Povalibacter sp. TaxID=1962978 RepID=UPI002F424B0B
MTGAARNTRALQLAARREQFLAAAERMFLKDGFANTSVNAIVREAGGSLATLYAEFGTKEALFESVLSERAVRFFPEARPQRASSCSGAEAKLKRLATHMLQRMLSEDALAVYRICVHEAPRFPGLRKAVLETGIPGLLQGTARYIADLATTPALGVEDTNDAASQFVALVQGQLVLMAALGANIDTSTRERQVANAVRAFLRLYPACSGKRNE